MKQTAHESILQHIDFSNDELIWYGHPPRMFLRSPLFFFGLTLNIAIVTVGIWKIYRLILANKIDPSYFVSKGFLFGTAGWLIIVIGLIKLVQYSMHQQSVIYGFTKEKAFWMNKGAKFKVNELPFSDIQKIDLVGRTDAPDTFTIYFSPSKKLDFGGYNYEKNDTRPFPTFELLERGDVVYKKLEEAINDYKRKK